jgi:putative flippase GtrA
MQELVITKGENSAPAVSIVMPCLNEMQSLTHCISNAQEALALIGKAYGLAGEIIIADNGSTDGSQALAEQLGARVIAVDEKGYGAAIMGGFDQALGDFLVMGDCDGSYDFTDSVPMIGRLVDGADLCMGSRLRGGIAPGAMPWKNRYIGNPVLTGMLNLFFRSGIGDAHCGLRAIRRDAYAALGLSGLGMEFASEMVIKSSLRRMRIDEVPATLSRDLRDRPPHLRPWRDGWRHLRYLVMLSPTWAFAVPATLMALVGAVILASVGFRSLGLVHSVPFGESWSVIGGLLLSTGHLALIMALVAQLAGARAGYRRAAPWLFAIRGLLTFESFLLSGLTLVIGSVLAIGGAFLFWSAHDFHSLPTILPVVLAGLASTIGFQTVFGGVLLAVISGHQADFLGGLPRPAVCQEAAEKPAHGVPAYVLVASFCVVLNNLIMIGLDHGKVRFELAQLISAMVLLPVGYWLMSHSVFKRERSWNSFRLYSIALLSNYPVQFVFLWLLCDRLALPMVVSAPISTLLLIVWNYTSCRWALARSAMA